jgi:outer membrane protein OmpA-like peptidoglycan-associated protein
MKIKSKSGLVSMGLLVALLGGCATQGTNPDGSPDRNNTAIGAVVGAVAGAVIGGQLDDDGNRDRGVITGAVVGAAAGAGIGHHMDKQEQAFRDALAAEQRRSEIEIQRVTDDLLKLTFDSEVTFDYDKAVVKSSFRPSLDKIAEVMAKYQSSARIVGHTDSTGTAEYNQRLSEQRANAVKQYLVNTGVPNYSLSAEGRGEYEPRESNVTEEGRALNRRVEFFVRSQG